jgi:hypothetical protein
MRSSILPVLARVDDVVSQLTQGSSGKVSHDQRRPDAAVHHRCLFAEIAVFQKLPKPWRAP